MTSLNGGNQLPGCLYYLLKPLRVCKVRGLLLAPLTRVLVSLRSLRVLFRCSLILALRHGDVVAAEVSSLFAM